MRKAAVLLLAMILAFASVAVSAQKIEDIPWDQAHIKQVRALGKHAVFRFLIRQVDPDNELESTESSVVWGYNWYPAGDGKYELAIGYAFGPDVSNFTVFWWDGPGKIRSQGFNGVGDYSEQWYDGPDAADLNGDGIEELIQFESLGMAPQRTKFIPSGTWPSVHRLRDGKYVESSRDFPTFYENKILPKLDKAIVEARKDLPAAGAKPLGTDPDVRELPARYLAALTMCRDKILRVLGRDPNAGLPQAREWMTSPDPVMVDNARVVFQDIGGHDEDVRAAKLATERAAKNWPNKAW